MWKFRTSAKNEQRPSRAVSDVVPRRRLLMVLVPLLRQGQMVTVVEGPRAQGSLDRPDGPGGAAIYEEIKLVYQHETVSAVFFFSKGSSWVGVTTSSTWGSSMLLDKNPLGISLFYQNLPTHSINCVFCFFFHCDSVVENFY